MWITYPQIINIYTPNNKGNKNDKTDTIDNMLTFFFPRFCFGCGYVGLYICPACVKKINEEKEQCFYCGELSHLGMTHFGCKRKDGVDGFFALYRYDGLLRKLIHLIKYEKAHKILEEGWLEKSKPETTIHKWTGLFPQIKVQPLPLHEKKERERGFNQTKILANQLLRTHRIKERLINVLVRIKNTESQTKMHNSRERNKNVRDAFDVIAYKTIDKSVLLIDDVVTSGSTIQEATKTLKRKGVVHVLVLALAKG